MSEAGVAQAEASECGFPPPALLDGERPREDGGLDGIVCCQIAGPMKTAIDHGAWMPGLGRCRLREWDVGSCWWSGQQSERESPRLRFLGCRRGQEPSRTERIFFVLRDGATIHVSLHRPDVKM